MDMWLLVLLPALILPWVCRAIWPHKITWLEMGIQLGVGALLTTVVYVAGVHSQTADTELLNGEVVSKQRTHGSYLRSYDCRCRQVCTGSGNSRSCNRKCDTCYENRYTVTWACDTTLGKYTIEHFDRTSRSVYDSPDPAFFTQIQKGDPVARKHAFTNYVKAAPDSLFHHFDAKSNKFKDLIPEYPLEVYNFYSVNRVLPVGVNVPDIKEWNWELSLLLRKLGPQKQANVVIVLVNTADQSYIHALEGKWIGGKKNDIIVVIGTTSYPKIDWVAVSSWTDSQIFKVQLRDEIMALGTVDRTKVLSAIDTHTMKSFVRKSMKDFEYLKHKAEPPVWVLTLAIVLGMLASIGCSFYFHRNDPFGNTRYTRSTGFR